MKPETAQGGQASYQLYEQVATELGIPIDGSLAPQVRLELYRSKLIYLDNLYRQCFLELNREPGPSQFTTGDLASLRQAYELTQAFLRQTSLECMRLALDGVARRRERLRRQLALMAPK